MTDETKSTFVTRKELYGILGSVYVLIATALLTALRLPDQHILSVIGHCLIFVVAVAFSFVFSFLAIRERRREARDLAAQGASADRPRG